MFRFLEDSYVPAGKVSLSGIYAIVNKITHRFYVGQAVNFDRRWANHKSILNKPIVVGASRNYLKNAWKKFKGENFKFMVIEYLTAHTTEDLKFKLKVHEQAWLDFAFSDDNSFGCYNLAPTASSNLGVKYSEDSRARMRVSIAKAIQDKYDGPEGEAYKNLLRDLKNELYSGVRGDEVKEKKRVAMHKFFDGPKGEAHKAEMSKRGSVRMQALFAGPDGDAFRASHGAKMQAMYDGPKGEANRAIKSAKMKAFHASPEGEVWRANQKVYWEEKRKNKSKK